jgi:tight adherence protein C
MNQLLLPITVFLAVVCLGGALMVIYGRRSERKSIAPRLRGVQGGFGGGSTTAVMEPPTDQSGMAKVVRGIGGIATRSSASLTLKQQLATAGYFGESAAVTYIGIKLLLMVVGFAAASSFLIWLDVSFAATAYVSVLFSGMLFFVPNIVVSLQRSARRGEVRRHLPDVVDLLEICVSAGMGLDMAWNSVADEIRSVSMILADEMALTMLETQLGAPRTVAMRHMAQRTGAQELASLVALLVQSDRFGTSVAEALRTFAASMRDMRSQRAEEAAEKTAVKLLFPLVFCIFPVMLIVTVGPAAINLYQHMISK